jgi:SPX domain protein involved in polyphosphate accumulation
MVQFGKAIEEQRVPEWADGYVDYKALKETLSAMIANGLIQKFSEDTVYSPISVATSNDILQPTGPGEHEFMAQLDAEMEKVNRFTERLHADLHAQVSTLQAQKDAWEAAGQPGEEVAALVLAVDAAAMALQRFEDYVNLNYMAFSKILKKHDKFSTCPYRMPYLMKIQSQTFVREKMADVIKALSDTRAALDGRAVRAGAQTFDPNQKGGASFIRNTSKYWVHTRDVLKVKMFVLRNRPIYKFTDGPSDADLVTSIYFDNEALDLYEGRLKKLPGAIAFRIRWYGATEAPPLVFIERKTHQARPARPEPAAS